MVLVLLQNIAVNYQIINATSSQGCILLPGSKPLHPPPRLQTGGEGCEEKIKPLSFLGVIIESYFPLYI